MDTANCKMGESVDEHEKATGEEKKGKIGHTSKMNIGPII
jgi:hypothetical protein